MKEAILPEWVEEGIVEVTSTNISEMSPAFTEYVKWTDFGISSCLGYTGKHWGCKNIKEFPRTFPDTDSDSCDDLIRPTPLERPGLQPTSLILPILLSYNYVRVLKGVMFDKNNSSGPFPFSECFHIHYLGAS